MGKVSVSTNVEAPVETLWGIVSDFCEVSWMQGVERCEQEGEGENVTRLIYAVGAEEPVREVCEGIDQATRTLRYTITENLPLPVTDYHATVVAHARGDDGSRLEWSCTFEPVGEEAAATQAVEGMYGVLTSWVKAAAEAR